MNPLHGEQLDKAKKLLDADQSGSESSDSEDYSSAEDSVSIGRRYSEDLSANENLNSKSEVNKSHPFLK